MFSFNINNRSWSKNSKISNEIFKYKVNNPLNLINQKIINSIQTNYRIEYSNNFIRITMNYLIKSVENSFGNEGNLIGVGFNLEEKIIKAFLIFSLMRKTKNSEKNNKNK